MQIKTERIIILGQARLTTQISQASYHVVSKVQFLGLVPIKERGDMVEW